MIGTFYERHENTFALMHRLFVDATRQPDEAWLMCETEKDAEAIHDAFAELTRLRLITGQPSCVRVVVHPTPHDGTSYQEIPYSRKINWALDRANTDAVVYLDNGSMPGPDKYRTMVDELERLGCGAVYCTQKRTGYLDETFVADAPVDRPGGRLNYTQVMHRPTADRWTTDMRYANPDLADSMFWDALAARFGAFQPAGGTRIHDDHHMPGPHAAGI